MANNNKKVQTKAYYLTELEPKDKVERKESFDVKKMMASLSKGGMLLIGNKGTGKRSIIEKIQYDIKNGNVPNALKGKKIYELDLSNFLIQTDDDDEFAIKLNNTIAKLKEPDSVLFIENVGLEFQNDIVSNLYQMIFEEMNRGRISVIATMTKDDYDDINESDVMSLFKPIEIDEPDEDTLDSIIAFQVEERSKLYGIEVKHPEGIVESLISLKIKCNIEINTSKPEVVLDTMEEVFSVLRLTDQTELNAFTMGSIITQNDKYTNTSKFEAQRILAKIIRKPKNEEAN